MAPIQKTVVSQPLVIPDEFKDYRGPSLQGQYAGFVSRLLAFVVDLLIIFVTYTLVSLAIVFFLNFFGLVEWFNAAMEGRARFATLVRLITAVGSFGFIAFFYSVISITITGGLSLGRGLIGVRVVRMDGLPITFLRAIRRYIGFYLALLPFGLGLLWIIVDDRRQGWHDKFAKTCVIYDWPAHESGGMLARMKARFDYVRDSRGRIHDIEDTPAAPESLPESAPYTSSPYSGT